jgi:DNA-binding SARP family transcriptional activator
LSNINNAIKLLRLAEDEDLIVKCFDIKAMILFRTGKNESAITELRKFSNAKLKPENKVGILCSLAEFHGMLSEHEAALNLSEEAISILGENKLIKVNSRLYNVLAISYRAIGNLTKAQFYFEKALETADNTYSKIMIISNMAIQQFNSGKFNDAVMYINRAYELLGSPSPRDLLIHVLKCDGYLRLLIGDYEKSQTLLEEAYRLSEKSNDLVRMKECIMGLFYCCYYLSERETCIEYLKRGRVDGNKYHKSIFDVCEAYLNDGTPNPLIEESLLNAHAYFHSNANSIWEAEVSFCLTSYYLRSNMIDSALNYIKIFLETVSANQYLGVFQNYILKSRYVFDFALSRPELNKYKGIIKQLFDGVFDRPQLVWTSDEYKREMKIQVETLYDIEMISFGSLQFTLRGNPVQESKWRKKKGKSILAYMMLKPEARLNKDKLIDIFFPDINPETLEENFRQALFNIRSVFKNPYLNILLYEGKMLYLNPDCYYNSDTFEFDKNYNAARSGEKNADEKIKACKEAVGLYKGEFLEGYYERWCEDIRYEYANKFISVSELLLELLKEKDRFEELIDYSENLIKHDKLNEQAYISLVEAYTRTNKTETARKIYTRMLKAYQEELGEKPRHGVSSRISQLIEV